MTIKNNFIAVIIVNFGTADLAIKAVESVLKDCTHGASIEVHLVDNASPGNDADQLVDAHNQKGWGDRVALYLEDENHGFGRGNNLVLRKLVTQKNPPEKVFLLNPDAQISNDALKILSSALDADPHAAASGASIVQPDGTPVTAAFRYPTLVSELARMIKFGPLDRILARWRVPLSPEHPEGPVDWVSGAAVMFRTKAIREVGFFDPDFFLYFEEVELIRRLANRGWRALYVPRAKAIHIGGAATGQFSSASIGARLPSYRYQSWRYYFTKSHGRAYALSAALLLFVAAPTNIAQRRLRGLQPTLPQAFFRDHWRYVVRPLLFPGTSS